MKKTGASNQTPDGHFQNPYTVAPQKSFFSFLWMRMRTDWVDVTEASQVPKVKVNPVELRSSQQDQVLWLGHSTFLIQVDGVNILTDPVFSERASPVSFAGPKRYTPIALKLDELPQIDAVVISHNHYDHLDQDSITKIETDHDPFWYVPLKNRPLLEEAKVPKKQIIELDWWQESSSTLGSQKSVVKFTATPAQHWSARGLFDRNEMLWSSWAIQINDYKVFFGGDTGYNKSYFKDIGQRLGPFDLGLIPIGAYAPRAFMRYSHVEPRESVKIHIDIKAKQSFGAHWGTFPLTAEPIMDPPKRLKEALKDSKLSAQSFITPILGYIYPLAHDGHSQKIIPRIE